MCFLVGLNALTDIPHNARLEVANMPVYCQRWQMCYFHTLLPVAAVAEVSTRQLMLQAVGSSKVLTAVKETWSCPDVTADKCASTYTAVGGGAYMQTHGRSFGISKLWSLEPWPWQV